MPFNTPGMFRGLVKAGSEPFVAIYPDEYHTSQNSSLPE
jgi:hypothetical protein